MDNSVERKVEITNRYEIFGKNQLGECGFCLHAKKVKEHYKEMDGNVEYIIRCLTAGDSKKRVIMTSMTGVEDIAYNDGDYIPTVIRYRADYENTYSLDRMFEKKAQGDPIPTADFICWDGEEMQNLIVTTFSRTAPVLYFECSNGMCCLGTVLKKPIISHGEYIFQKIIGVLTRGAGITPDFAVCCRLVTCTDYEYPDMGTISSKIKPVLEAVGITDYEFLYGTNANKDWLYQNDDIGDHVVACVRK